MKKIILMDATLCQTGAASGNGLSFREKLEIVRTLSRLNVDVLALPVLTAAKADETFNKTASMLASTAVSASVPALGADVEAAWESIRTAKAPCIDIQAPVSTVQMEYMCHKKAPAMLECIAAQVQKARYLCETVSFTALDATRAEPDFLKKAIDAATGAGATQVVLCDSAGEMLPDEFGAFVASVREGLDPERVRLCVQASDLLGMGAACAAAAIKAGADGIVCASVAAGLPTLAQVNALFAVKGADLGVECGVRATEVTRAVDRIARLYQPKSPTLGEMQGAGGEDASVAGVTLEQGDPISEVVKVVRQLGYELSDEDNARVYEAFCRVAARKHFVGTREMDAIVSGTALQVPPTYHIENYVINSGNVITATANLLLSKNGEKIRGVGVGDGPIDAAFLAIEQIIGHHYELDDFQIQTVTEGRDAMGSALVKLRANGRIYSGNGISTDIIGASIRAYISALNKIVFEEE